MARELLSGQVALVTGASRGIGAAVATAFGRDGAAVGVNYHRNRAAADAVVAEIAATGGRALAVRADVTDDDQVAAMVDAVRSRFGEITALVCNAVGDTASMAARTDLLDDGPAIRAQVDVQLASTLAACRHVVPGMRRHGSGSIVLVGAAVSRQSSVRPGLARIGVVKAAQDALARHLAAELGRDGIRVNVVAPGLVPTDANAGEHRADVVAALSGQAPLGRVSTVEDVAGAVLGLSSGLFGQVTGAFVAVDGGITMT